MLNRFDNSNNKYSQSFENDNGSFIFRKKNGVQSMWTAEIIN